MLTEVTGDLFKCVTSIHPKDFVIYHGCNAQGRMGAGFAKTFKEKFPKAYQTYLYHLANYNYFQNTVGTISVYLEKEMALVSAITQAYYGREAGVVYADIKAIEKTLKETIDMFPGKTIHMPRVGSGNGGLDWDVVKGLLENIDKHHNPNNNQLTIWSI